MGYDVFKNNTPLFCLQLILLMDNLGRGRGSGATFVYNIYIYTFLILKVVC